MRVLILGGAGQVGRALQRCAPSEVVLAAPLRSQLDLSQASRLETYLGTFKPAVVINSAAHTAVDRAESEYDLALRVNGSAVADLATLCASRDIRLIHISTDYVFDGTSNLALEPDAQTHPLNAYGRSKLAGEQAIRATGNLNWSIVRAAWIYAPWGQNFVLTMLRLMRERGAVSVVCDQIGSPLSALTLASFLWRLVACENVNGTLHCADAGVASWYDFSVAIAEEAYALEILSQRPTIKPISTAEFPTPAKRPAFSVLSGRSSMDTVRLEQKHWRVGLREVLQEIKASA